MSRRPPAELPHPCFTSSGHVPARDDQVPPAAHRLAATSDGGEAGAATPALGGRHPGRTWRARPGRRDRAGRRGGDRRELVRPRRSRDLRRPPDRPGRCVHDAHRRPVGWAHPGPRARRGSGSRGRVASAPCAVVAGVDRRTRRAGRRGLRAAFAIGGAHRDLDPADHPPGHARHDGRVRAPRARGGHVLPGCAATHGVRDLVGDPPVHVPGVGAVVLTPARHGRLVRRASGCAGVLGRAVARDGWRGARVPRRATGLAEPAPRSAGHRGHPGGTGCRLARRVRSCAGPAPRVGRAVPQLEVPRPRFVVAGARVLGVGVAAGRADAGDGEEPRRPQRRARPAPHRHARRDRRSVRGVHRRPREPTSCAHRRRGRRGDSCPLAARGSPAREPSGRRPARPTAGGPRARRRDRGPRPGPGGQRSPARRVAPGST